jgi:protein-disulfide isomerase
MSAKAERRAQARAAREAAERAEREKAARRRRLGVLGGVVALAAVVLVAVIALSSSGDDGEPRRASSPAASAELFAGIPQRGTVLGDPDAPVTVEEYVDLQCPVCAQFSAEALPELVRDYVRPGRVRLVLRPLTFLGEDSVPAARMALAAGEQDRMFQFVERFYAEQGEENSGYVTDDFLRRIATGIEGLDPARALAARESAPVTEELERAQERTRLITGPDGGYGTPSFLVGPTGGDLELVQLQTLGLDDLRGPIEEAER